MWRCGDGVQRCGMEPRNSSNLKSPFSIYHTSTLIIHLLEVSHVDRYYQELSMA